VAEGRAGVFIRTGSVWSRFMLSMFLYIVSTVLFMNLSQTVNVPAQPENAFQTLHFGRRT
jgi:hypothetical protein